MVSKLSVRNICSHYSSKNFTTVLRRLPPPTTNGTQFHVGCPRFSKKNQINLLAQLPYSLNNKNPVQIRAEKDATFSYVFNLHQQNLRNHVFYLSFLLKISFFINAHIIIIFPLLYITRDHSSNGEY